MLDWTQIEVTLKTLHKLFPSFFFPLIHRTNLMLSQRWQRRWLTWVWMAVEEKHTVWPSQIILKRRKRKGYLPKSRNPLWKRSRACTNPHGGNPSHREASLARLLFSHLRVAKGKAVERVWFSAVPTARITRASQEDLPVFHKQKPFSRYPHFPFSYHTGSSSHTSLLPTHTPPLPNPHGRHNPQSRRKGLLAIVFAKSDTDKNGIWSNERLLMFLQRWPYLVSGKIKTHIQDCSEILWKRFSS